MKTNAHRLGILKLLFQNISFAGIGDSGGLLKSVADGSFYLSLHTDDPGLDGDQTTFEVNYDPYARLAVARTNVAWTIIQDVTNTRALNAAKLLFAQCVSGENEANYFGLGTQPTGTGILLYAQALDPQLNISEGIQPTLEIGAISIAEDSCP